MTNSIAMSPVAEARTNFQTTRGRYFDCLDAPQLAGIASWVEGITLAPVVREPRPHPQCATALDQWYRLCKKADWHNFAELRTLFPGTDKVGDVFVFDIGGNKLRLVAAIHFNTGRLFIRTILTHKDYDRGGWK